jgi:hypothetical protein
MERNEVIQLIVTLVVNIDFGRVKMSDNEALFTAWVQAEPILR